jgi:hypothetical protein
LPLAALMCALLPLCSHAAPVAQAPADLTSPLGQEVVLDGSGSRAADGSAAGLSFHWRQVTEPDLVESLPTCEAPSDFGEGYGTRLRGYLHPPATGAYTFWIASDDAGELWLSGNAAAEGRRLVARVSDWTAPRGWDQSALQRSEAITLEAGKAYSLEVLHKEGGGGDHLAVAWRGPGSEREVIPGACLSPAAAGPEGPRGSITREVWRDLPGSRVSDLTASPRFPGGPAVALTGADSATARFTPTSGGRYAFELGVGDATGTATCRVSLLVTDVLRNGDFEAGALGRPEAWEPPADAPGLSWRWEENAGIGGSRCLSLTTTDPTRPLTADFSQSLQLAPYAPYLLRGSMRFAHLAKAERYPASLGFGSLWKADNGPAPQTHDLDWTPFEVDVANDPAGRAEVHCRLSAAADGQPGTVYFDNLSLVRNPDVETFQSRNFVLNLYADQVGIAGREVVERIMRDVDRVCEAYTELTGWAPGGERQAAWAPDKWDIQALGWSGNPTLWSGDRKWMRENWRREAYMPEVFLHELGHNWDNERYTFHGHFCEFKMAYALETCDLAIAEDGYTRGPATRNRWEVRSAGLRKLGKCDELVQTYRNLQIRDRVGWEPFKKVYRYFLALPADEVPRDAWDKFKLWHDKLSEFSGFDAWSVYAPGEIEYARAYYAPRPDPDSLPEPAAVDAGTRSISLTGTKWTTAEVGWDAPHTGIEGSADRWHAEAIYAHAPSRYTYNLGGAWSQFRASCALARGNAGSVVFVVLGDGRELWRSERVQDAAERAANVEVAGVQELALVVEDAGDGRNSDHGTWFSPTLTR